MVGGELLRRFWHTQPTLTNVIKYYTDTYFEGNMVIGFQLHYDTTLGDLNDTQELFKCAQDIERLLAAPFDNVKWFVTSNSPKMLDNLDLVSNERIFMSEKHIDMYEGDPFSKSILDMELLSRCDHIIVARPTSFGILASMKAKQLPYVVNRMADGKCEHLTLNYDHFLSYFEKT